MHRKFDKESEKYHKSNLEEVCTIFDRDSFKLVMIEIIRFQREHGLWN